MNDTTSYCSKDYHNKHHWGRIEVTQEGSIGHYYQVFKCSKCKKIKLEKLEEVK